MGQSQGHELPFDIGEQFTCVSGKSVWNVHAGTKKTSGDPVTVFVFDYTDKSPDEVKCAQSAHLRLKTLRHPNVLKYIDGIELPTTIYMVTEEATPLEEYIDTPEGRSNFSTSWGLHQILKAVSFLSKDCGLVHRNVCLSSIFVDSAGEWKLAGVEFMIPHSETNPPPKILTSLKKYDPPETGKPGAAKKGEKWSTDVWGLGCLVWEVFNGPLSQVSALRNTTKIPKSLVPYYCEMVSASIKSRPSPSKLLEQLREPSGFLANHHVSIALTIEEIQIMEPAQRSDFFNYLNKHLDSFPKNFSKCKILPQLINAFEFGGAGSTVLAPLFKLGSLLEDKDYQSKIVPCVVKMFSSTDRATRLNLLKQLEHFIGHLHSSTVNQIFPNIADGFSDTIPAMREQTVKAMVLVAPKLSGAAMCSQLLKHLAKCQMDDVSAIRVNTNICLGKIAPHLEPGTRRKVLATAFIRALKDPFPPARIASIDAMAATHPFYPTSDMATKLIPALAPMTLDKEKEVRDHVFKTMHIFLDKLERISEDPVAAQEQEKSEAAGSTSWTGWAVSSFASKFYKPPTSTNTTTASGSSQKQSVEKQQASVPVVKSTAAATAQSRSEEKETSPQQLPPDESGWNDDEWEDFSTETPSATAGNQAQPEFSPEVEVNEESDMEGWDDDGWGDLDPAPTTTQTIPTSGADFFDTFESKSSKPQAKPNDDFFDTVPGHWSAKSSKKEKTPPPPVSASLFSGGGGASDSWGDWGDDYTQSTKQTSNKVSRQTESKSTAKVSQFDIAPSKKEPAASGGVGWSDFDDTSWGTMEDTPSKSSSNDSAKQEELKRKREERRLKQQAAREKRAAGVGLKPSSLGAVKKD